MCVVSLGVIISHSNRSQNPYCSVTPGNRTDRTANKRQRTRMINTSVLLHYYPSFSCMDVKKSSCYPSSCQLSFGCGFAALRISWFINLLRSRLENLLCQKPAGTAITATAPHDRAAGNGRGVDCDAKGSEASLRSLKSFNLRLPTSSSCG